MFDVSLFDVACGQWGCHLSHTLVQIARFLFYLRLLCVKFGPYAVACQRHVDLLGFSLLLVWLELVVVALSVDRSLEARAERSRGSTGTSSASGEVAGSHAQPSARAADHTANTNVNIVGLSSHAPPAAPARTPATLE